MRRGLTRKNFLHAAGAGVLGLAAVGLSANVLSTDDYSSIQEALDAANPGQTVYVPARANPYSVNTNIRVPEYVTLFLDTAISLNTSGSIELDAPGAALTGGLVFINAWEPSWAVRIGKDNCVIEGVDFRGSARTSAVSIRYDLTPSAAGTITGGSIRNCTFEDTQYAVLKEGTETVVNHFQVQGNSFRNIRGGDAIEWNEGGGVGVLISDNTIANVAEGDVENAGIAIGLAGNGTSRTSESAHRAFVVANNSIIGAHEGIHVEAGCNDFLVANNFISDLTATRTLTGAGVQIWGCDRFDVLNNVVSEAVIGVAVAEQGSDFSGDFKVAGNTSRECTIGHSIAVSSTEKSVTLQYNEATKCEVGYDIKGCAEWVIKDNNSHACGRSSFDFDPHPGVEVTGGGAIVKDNTFADESGRANLTVEGLESLKYLADEGNSFSLDATGA